MQLVMEYVPLGSLRDYLPRHSVGLAQLLLFAQQICEVGQRAWWSHTVCSPLPTLGPAPQPSLFPPSLFPCPTAQSLPIPTLPFAGPPAILPVPAPAWSPQS